MTLTFHTTSGVEIELDMENEEVKFEGTVQDGDFQEHLQFINEMVMKDELVAPEEN